jgi:hypothetical protein
MESGNTLILGLASDEIAVRSDTLGGTLTPTNTNLRSGTNLGSADIQPIRVDTGIIMVHRYGKKLYELIYDFSRDAHGAVDLTKMCPQLIDSSITGMASARYPETQTYVVLDDGTMRVFVADNAESVSAWCRDSTQGLIKRVISTPGEVEDSVYFSVYRNGKYLMEKKALVANCVGGTVNHTFDSFKQYSSPGTTITGLEHLDGMTVGVWGDGRDRGDYVVSGAQTVVEDSWDDVVVGLRYTGVWVSNKLAGFVKGSVMGIRKRIVDVFLVAKNILLEKVKIGPDADTLTGTPGVEDGVVIDQGVIRDEYHELPFDFDGIDEVDPRIYIEVKGPATIMAVGFGIKGNAPGGDDVVEVKGEPFKHSFRGYAAEVNQRVVGIFGVLHTHPPQLFSELTKEARLYPFGFGRAGRLAKELIETYDSDVYAYADPTQGASERFLEHIGFSKVKGSLFVKHRGG